MNNDPKNILGKISDFFIERYRVAYLIIAAIVLLGLQAYMSLPREEMPEVVVPFAIVSANYPGAAPQEIETLITDKIETKIKEVDDIESITSTSSNGTSSITVEFAVDTDINEKIDEIQDKISSIESELPEDSTSPIVKGFATSDEPIMTLNISGDYDLIKLKNISEDIKSQIENVQGVDEVTIVGGLEREIDIYVDSSQLAAYNLSINQIRNAIESSNINMPGGNIDLDDMNYTVRTVAEFDEISEMEDLIVTVQNGSPIYLKDIAHIEDTYEKATSYSEMYERGVSSEETATPTITLSVTRGDDADTIGISNEIKEILNEGKGNLYPDDVFISIMGDVAIEVDETLNDVLGNALSGLLIVIVVLFLFIGFRESLIVAFVIPLSLLSSFILMKYNDITLNSMSLVSLILAIGMLVDNAIVIMENIDRIRDEGHDIYNASKFATNQVAPAVFAATLTTMSAFLPMAMTSGVMGEFMKIIPITVMFAIGASFVMSIVVTPALCSRFLSKYKTKIIQNKGKLDTLRKVSSVIFVFVLSLYAFMNDGSIGLLSWACAIIFAGIMFVKEFKSKNSSHGDLKIINAYVKWMDKILISRGKRTTLVIASILFFFASLATIPLGLLKIDLFPTTDNTSFTIDIETPSGYLLEDTKVVTQEVEDVLFNYPEIESFVSKIGNTGGRIFGSTGDSSNIAQISIDLVAETERDISSMEIIDNLRKDLKEIAGAKITVEQAAMGPSSRKPVSIEIIGEDFDDLSIVADDFKEILKDIPGTTEVSTSMSDKSLEIQIVIDKEKASLLGLDIKSISTEIRNVINGIEVSTFKENQDETDIVIRTTEEAIISIDDFKKIYFTSNSGEKIVFSQVATLVETSGLNAIEHEDLKRTLKVESNLIDGANSNVILKEFRSKIEDYELPSDTKVSYGGDIRNIKESFTDMFFNMIVAVLLVFIILAIQFNSLSQPMVVLFSVPLATIGAMIGLIITGNNFGMFAFMGIVSLVGIAVNDAIVLVDYTNYLRKSGSGIIDAIKEAGKTRFLPVLATSITTIGGILPLALKNPDYAQMGFALIFGLVASTVLTLVYIPILYSIIEGLKEKMRKRVPILADRR